MNVRVVNAFNAPDSEEFASGSTEGDVRSRKMVNGRF